MGIRGNFSFSPNGGQADGVIKVTCGTTSNTAENKHTIDSQEEITITTIDGKTKKVNLIQFKKEEHDIPYIRPFYISTLGEGGFIDTEAIRIEKASDYTVYLKIRVNNYEELGDITHPMVINADVPASEGNEIGNKLQNLQTSLGISDIIDGDGIYYIKIENVYPDPINDSVKFRFYQQVDGIYHDLVTNNDYTNATDVPGIDLGTVQSSVTPPIGKIINY